MPQNNSYDVVERRNKIIILRAQGLTGSEIGKQLKISTIQVYEDIAQIKKQGAKFYTRLKKAELAFHFDMILMNTIQANKGLWKIVNNPEVETRDKINAYKAIGSMSTELRESIKDSINIFEVEDLKTRIQQLEKEKLSEQQSNKNKSFMNLELPYIIKDTPISNNNTPTNSDADNNNP